MSGGVRTRSVGSGLRAIRPSDCRGQDGETRTRMAIRHDRCTERMGLSLLPAFFGEVMVKGAASHWLGSQILVSHCTWPNLSIRGVSSFTLWEQYLLSFVSKTNEPVFRPRLNGYFFESYNLSQHFSNSFHVGRPVGSGVVSQTLGMQFK